MTTRKPARAFRRLLARIGEAVRAAHRNAVPF
jgi:hypothetical protein